MHLIILPTHFALAQCCFVIPKLLPCYITPHDRHTIFIISNIFEDKHHTVVMDKHFPWRSGRSLRIGWDCLGLRAGRCRGQAGRPHLPEEVRGSHPNLMLLLAFRLELIERSHTSIATLRFFREKRVTNFGVKRLKSLAQEDVGHRNREDMRTFDY